MQEFSGDDERLLEHWKLVFSSRVSLGLSFRKDAPKFAGQFLQDSAEFDCEALDSLAKLCHKCIPFKRALSEALVRFAWDGVVANEGNGVVQRFGRQEPAGN